MMNNKYNGINNRYQYTQDAMDSNEKKLQRALAQNEHNITSKYAADDIDVEDSQKFADSFGDEGYSGIFKAMEQGEVSGKRQRIARNKDEERAQGVAEARQFFEEQDRELREELRKIKVQEYAKEKMKPQITAYAKSMYNMTAENRTILAANIINKSNELLGDNDELVSIDGSNPMLWTIKNRDTEEMGVVDMGVLYAGSTLQEQELAEWNTAAIIKRDAEAKEKKEKLQLEKDKLEQKKAADAKALALKQSEYNNKNDPNIIGRNEFSKSKANTLGKDVSKYEKLKVSKENVVESFDRMQNLVDNNPWIFNTKNRNLSKWIVPDYEAGTMHFKEEIARQFLSDEKIDVIKRLNKDYNNILFDRVQSQQLGRMTNDIMHMDKKGLPLPWDMGKESFKQTVKTLQDNYRRDTAILDRDINIANKVSQGIDWLQQGGNEANSNQQSGSGEQMFTVESPIGERKQVPLRGLQPAIERGGKLVL